MKDKEDSAQHLPSHWHRKILGRNAVPDDNAYSHLVKGS